MNKYKVEVVFESTDKRRGKQLEFLITVTTNYAFRQDKLFVAELFKEIAYSDCTETMLSTLEANGRLEHFDSFLLDCLFAYDRYELAILLLKEFEIKKVVVFNPFGEEMVKYSIG